MKKILLILSLFCTSLLSFAQSNYYDWGKTSLNSGLPSSRGDGITFGDNSNLFYTTTSGYICNAYFSGGVWNHNVIWGAEKPKTNSVFVYGDGKLIYTDVNGKIRELVYNSGSGWSNAILNSSAPSSRGDGLVFAPNSNILYTTTSGSICNIYYDSGWNYNNITSVVSPKSGADFTWGDNKLFYTDVTNKIRALYWDSGWANPSLNSSAPASRGDGLVFGSSSNLYYITTDGNICNIYYVDDWYYNVVKYDALPTKNDLIFNDWKVYYRGPDNQIHALFYSNCKWDEKLINESHEAYAGSGSITPRMVLGDNKVFYTSNLNKMEALYPTITSSHPYVYLKGREFWQNNQEFYPLVMNYIVNINTEDHSSYWVSPHHSVSSDNTRCCDNQTEADLRMSQHFAEIKNLGFNSVRITASVKATNDPTDDKLYKNVKRTSDLINDEVEMTSGFQSRYVEMMEHVVELADAAHLKVILLCGNNYIHRPDVKNKYGALLGELADSLEDQPALLAYDIYNEPGQSREYPTEFNKDYICGVVQSWYNEIRSKDPNHLVTMGSFGVDDLEVFDPTTLSVDFVSIHKYPISGNDEIESHWYWYRNNLEKPWIVGETGFSAFDAPDSCSDNPLTSGTHGWGGTEAQQLAFANFVQPRTVGCGGSGFSWWAYKDVYHGSDGDFEGVFTRCGDVKPVGASFDQNWLSYSCSDCPKPADNVYYRTYQSNYKVTGIVKDTQGNPIKDALVLGWNPDGSHYTLTKSDGSFTLCLDNRIYSIDENGDLGKGKIRVTGAGKKNWDTWFQQTNAIHNIGTVTLNDMTCSSLPLLQRIGDIEEDPISQDYIEKSFEWSVYPVPTTGNINVKVSEYNEGLSVEVRDIMGTVVVEKHHLSEQTTSIDLNLLSNGVYLVSMYRDNHVEQKRIILAK